jgi:hypothetical protein
MKTISQTIAAKGQKVEAERFIAHGPHMLRAVIISDSIDYQSSARLHIWSPDSLSWNFLVGIPYSLMKTPSKTASSRNGECVQNFRDDFQALYVDVLPALKDRDSYC